jgi:hypothetical protein
VPETSPKGIKRSGMNTNIYPFNVETPSYMTSPSNLIMVQLGTEATLPFDFVSVAVWIYFSRQL